MNNTQLYIPKKCKVGLQIRQGTYTGKLGYIIYHDGKTWRKEKSWEDWRHKEGQHTYRYNDQTPIATGVEPIEFDNVPTEGFVLNKKVGGDNSGWNHRQTYSRVYDPRGWEFEITIPNLLYILQECSSYKGKGLEGSFVYSWDGKDLVLLPTTSPDYALCEDYTNLQSQKIGKKDLVEGCTYLTSKQEKLVYLGVYNICEGHQDNITNIEKQVKKYDWDQVRNKLIYDKKHVFKRLSGKSDWDLEYHPYEFLNAFSKLKAKVSDDVDPKFADYVDELQKSHFISTADHLVVESFDEKDIEHLYHNEKCFMFGKITSVTDLTNLRRYIKKESLNEFKVYVGGSDDYNNYWWYSRGNAKVEGVFTLEEIKQKYGKLMRVYTSGYKEKV